MSVPQPPPSSAQVKDWESADELLGKWRDTIGVIQNAHYRSAIYTEKFNLWLGVPVVIITTVVGSTVFATLQSQVDPSYRIALGLFSLLAAVLASLQTFFNYKERAERHRSGGVRFGALLRHIDEVRSLPFESRGDAKQFLDMVRNEWDSLQKDTPMISQHVWKKNKQIPKAIADRED